MPKFALTYPYFIIMLCLVAALVGIVSVVGMPVDLFPQIDMPVVVVATFYNGMPPEQIESDITNTFERFFTLASNVDHSESRSLTGVSLIKIYFKPGTDPNAALSNIANLAMADLRRLPPGTLPPVVLGMDASTQPVCLVTLKGEGLNETHLKDLAQFQVRNQISNVQGASVPQPYGGTYRQIQIYVDPLKMEARNLSLNDVVQSVGNSNLILPAGDVRIGSKDFNIYANSQFRDASAMNSMPLKTVGNSSVLVGDIGKAVDSGALQYNIVRIDGQRSVYVPIFKQGGNSNTTTRFRRYIGQRDNRPLLPENDLRTPDVLLQPNVPLHIRLVADGPDIAYFCNNRRLFFLHDPAPYTHGHFGFRTTWAHLQIQDLRITALPPHPQERP